MAQAAIPLMGAGGIMGAMGAIKGGQQAQAAGQYNAGLAEQNANINDQQKALAIRRQQTAAGNAIANAHAQYSSNGIDASEGSALDVLAQSASEAALDTELTKYQYNLKSAGLRNTAKMYRFEGDQAMDNSYYSAAGSLLGTAGNIAGKM